jgi:hypothetical protein
MTRIVRRSPSPCTKAQRVGIYADVGARSRLPRAAQRTFTMREMNSRSAGAVRARARQHRAIERNANSEIALAPSMVALDGTDAGTPGNAGMGKSLLHNQSGH